MKISRVIRIIFGFVVASALSGIFCLFMLVAVADNVEYTERLDNVQYTCAEAQNYASCYRQETGNSLMSISGDGDWIPLIHLVLGGVMTLGIFATLFIAIGLPDTRKKILQAMG